MPSVSLAPRELVGLVSLTGTGKPIVQISGFPSQDEAVTTEHLRDLAERLYQIADGAERGKQIISLRY